MRVLVATDTVAGLSSVEAGRVLADGWAAAEVTVLPMGDAGAGFAQALADLTGLPVSIEADGLTVVSSAVGTPTGVVRVSQPPRDGIALEAPSSPLGAAVARLLDRQRPQRLYLDLAGLTAHDGGAGLLAALGASADRPLDRGVAGLTGLGTIDVEPVRRALTGVDLVGVVPADQLGQRLLGLRGITSLAGRALDLDTELLLRTDGALEAFARSVDGPSADLPGAGACGGLGFAVLALGGRLTSGPAVSLELAPPGRTDLVVTGCEVFDFARRGGGVVRAAAELATAALSPCVVLAGEVVIGAREMRTMGIEAAYAARESTLDQPRGGVTAEELAVLARRVARSWSW